MASTMVPSPKKAMEGQKNSPDPARRKGPALRTCPRRSPPHTGPALGRNRPPKPRTRQSRDEAPTVMKKAGRSNPNLFKLSLISKGMYTSSVNSSNPAGEARRRRGRRRIDRETGNCLGPPLSNVALGSTASCYTRF